MLGICLILRVGLVFGMFQMRSMDSFLFFLFVITLLYMVSFVCDSCQETLKKAKLDSHFSRCRNAQFSCIDCSVSFEGTSYKFHTSCISEEQKYQGHLCKPKAAKGNGNFAKVPSKPGIVEQIEKKLKGDAAVQDEPKNTTDVKDKSEKIIRKIIKKVLKMDGDRSIASLRSRTVALVNQKDASIASKKVKKIFDNLVAVDCKSIE